MTPPRRPHDPLTDTDKDLLAVADENAKAIAEAAVQKARDELTGEVPMSRTPTPGPTVTHSEVYEIAEKVAQRGRPQHMLECEGSGPVCKLRQQIEGRLDKMESTQEEHSRILAEFAGATKLTRWLVPIVTSLLSSAAAVAIFKLLWAAGR